MSDITNKFCELIQISIGTKGEFERMPTEKEWHLLFELASKHSLLGVLLVGVNNTKVNRENINQRLLWDWIGIQQMTIATNEKINDRINKLCKHIGGWGYRGCVLKGQGVAQLYPDPSLRQSGDIDLWIDGKQDAFIREVKGNGLTIDNIDYVHSGIEFFEDVKVEIHFRPSWMYNPFSNKRLQQYFVNNKCVQFNHYDENVSFAYPNIRFNLVYSLIHINRHIFEEGIGLRQLMDYYYILKYSTEEDRKDAIKILTTIKLRKFAGAVMYVLEKVFRLDSDVLLCPVNVSEGEFLLCEILRGGNFGRYDERNQWFKKGQRLKKNLFTIKRSLRYLIHYPSEVLWIPFWKIWHYQWRKRKGYL